MAVKAGGLLLMAIHGFTIQYKRTSLFVHVPTLTLIQQLYFGNRPLDVGLGCAQEILHITIATVRTVNRQGLHLR